MSDSRAKKFHGFVTQVPRTAHPKRKSYNTGQSYSMVQSQGKRKAKARSAKHVRVPKQTNEPCPTLRKVGGSATDWQSRWRANP